MPNEDPFASFKTTEPEVKVPVEKKKRGRKSKLKERAAVLEKTAATPLAAGVSKTTDLLFAVERICAVLHPLKEAEQQRVLHVINDFFG